MNFLAFLLLVVILMVIVVLLANRREVEGGYRQRKPLSPPEQILYWRLVDALPECVILSQVTFSRFMEPEAIGRINRQALFNRISQKSSDFLVCLKDFTVVAAVELDDSSHRAERDLRRDSLLKGAGVQVLRFQVRDIPSAEEIRGLFTK